LIIITQTKEKLSKCAGQLHNICAKALKSNSEEGKVAERMAYHRIFITKAVAWRSTFIEFKGEAYAHPALEDPRRPHHLKRS
jgi:hypothetical protein